MGLAFGSYLKEPVCEKISTDECNDNISYGASSMQGWRLTQEDAHNSILDFDGNKSLFAVYDGHGGHEVAQYCADKLPEFLRQVEAYKSGDLEKAMIDAFLGFDATIIMPEVIAELREIAGDKPEDEDESDDEEESVSQLNQEASMPLEELMEKYAAAGKNLTLAALKEGADKLSLSPFLKAKKSKSDAAGGSGSGSSLGCSKSAETVSSSSSSSRSDATSGSIKNGESDNGDVKSEVKVETKDEKKDIKEENGSIVPDIKITGVDDADCKDGLSTTKMESVDEAIEAKEVPKEHQNGEIVPKEENNLSKKTETDKSSSAIQENGDVSKKGKGKALAKTKGVCPPLEKKSRPKRTSQQMYAKLLKFDDKEEEESEDSDDEEDKTFTAVAESSDDSEQDVVNTSIELDETSDEEDENEDADDEEEDLDYDDEEDDSDENFDFVQNMKSGPGSDSGCTAVMALLVGNELYVANAGDSRCIVCRDGKAVDMSVDHKPEDAPERARVEKAGGEVTHEGRINNGLNLSRAIGDHAYKQNTALSDREQMITALPDVRRLTIEPGRDEFMVLACDGIWNYMSSDEVVEFVRARLVGDERPAKLSQICEKMFDHCLAPNTMGDGTGCDNMTGIIVEFKHRQQQVGDNTSLAGVKRASSPTPDEPSKRPKTELSAQAATTVDAPSVDISTE